MTFERGLLDILMFDSILVPTDGSDHALEAAEHGAALARVFKADLHVVSAVDIQTAVGPFNAGGLEPEIRARLQADAEEKITAVTEAIALPGSVQTDILTGNAVTEILAYCEDNGIDLIVMGTHGRTGVKRYVAGSVTEAVVRKAEVPVLTVRATDQNHVDTYSDILVPTDGSEFAAAAVEPALEIAATFDARVHALHVVDLGDVAFSADYTLPTELINHLQEEGEAATEELAARARDAGVDAVTEVLTGYPAREILDYAEENDIDMIAMGTAGRTGLSRFVLGSTTERVIRHAEMPVLAVNAREK
jgi:nucleotide-binding universal stress UspA family protein